MEIWPNYFTSSFITILNREAVKDINFGKFSSAIGEF